MMLSGKNVGTALTRSISAEVNSLKVFSVNLPEATSKARFAVNSSLMATMRQRINNVLN